MASKKLKINEINVLDMLSDDSDSSGESDIDESDIVTLIRLTSLHHHLPVMAQKALIVKQIAVMMK